MRKRIVADMTAQQNTQPMNRPRMNSQNNIAILNSQQNRTEQKIKTHAYRSLSCRLSIHMMLKKFNVNYFLVEGLLRKVIEYLPMIVKPDQANISMVKYKHSPANIYAALLQKIIRNNHNITTIILPSTTCTGRERV